MAYTLLIAVAPMLLFLWHLLGLFGTDPAKLHGMFSILKSFMPPDPKVQDALDVAAASVVMTGSSGLLANIGIIFGLDPQKFTSATQKFPGRLHGNF